jgi:hypothetical protein
MMDYGFHYRIFILFVDMLPDNSMCKQIEGWSECTDWDENAFTSTNPYTGEVYVFPIRNIASIHMEVIDDDKN